MINIWLHLNFFAPPPPGCVGLATALLVCKSKENVCLNGALNPNFLNLTIKKIEKKIA